MTFVQELRRKTIHLASSVIPITYWFLSKDLILAFLIPGMLLAIAIDYFRYHSDWFERFINKYFGSIIRESERKRLTGASFVLIADVVAIILFPKMIAIVGLLMLSVGDTAAALVGRGIGKHKIYQNKTWEGTLGFIIFGTIAANFVPGIPVYAAFAAAVAGALVELSFNALDDNIIIPVASGLVLMLVLSI